MNVIEVGNTFNCDCGLSWRRGQSGSHNCGDGLRKQIAELQQKLDAVLAENVVSRKAVQTFCDVVGGNTHAICEKVGADGVRAILAAMNATGNMPATDAILNAVREEGVEMVRRHPAISLCSLMHVCEEITAQLRAETDTTSSQYESLAGGK